MSDYTEQVKAWAQPIKTVEDLVTALKKLNEEYEPEETCPAFQVAKGLQDLAKQKKGLKIRVRPPFHSDAAEGCLYHFNDRSVHLVHVEQPSTEIAFGSYPYEDISSFTFDFEATP